MILHASCYKMCHFNLIFLIFLLIHQYHALISASEVLENQTFSSDGGKNNGKANNTVNEKNVNKTYTTTFSQLRETLHVAPTTQTTKYATTMKGNVKTTKMKSKTQVGKKSNATKNKRKNTTVITEFSRYAVPNTTVKSTFSTSTTEKNKKRHKHRYKGKKPKEEKKNEKGRNHRNKGDKSKEDSDNELDGERGRGKRRFKIGLMYGAIIGAAILVIIIGIIVFIFWLYRRSRRRKKKQTVPRNGMEMSPFIGGPPYEYHYIQDKPKVGTTDIDVGEYFVLDPNVTKKDKLQNRPLPDVVRPLSNAYEAEEKVYFEICEDQMVDDITENGFTNKTYDADVHNDIAENSSLCLLPNYQETDDYTYEEPIETNKN